MTDVGSIYEVVELRRLVVGKDGDFDFNFEAESEGTGTNLRRPVANEGAANISDSLGSSEFASICSEYGDR